MSLSLKGIVLAVAFTATMSSSSSGQLDEDFTAGVAALAQKNYDEAVRLLTKAVERHPSNTFALWGRGAAYYSLGEFEKAMVDYEDAIQIDPKFGLAFQGRGEVRLARAEYDKAITDFDEVIRLDPTSAPAHNDRAWIRATCPQLKYRDGAKAIEDATKACELSEWKMLECLDTLAASFAEARQFDKAVEWQEKAIDLAPESEKASFETRFMLYLERKPYREEPGKK